MTDLAAALITGSPAITDDLNYADGTNLTGQTLSNGDVWQCTGPSNPVVTGRKITNPGGNTYPGFPNVTAPGGTPQLVKCFGAPVRFLSSGFNCTLIMENWAAGPISTMIHYNFGPAGWGLMVMLAGVWQSQTWSGAYNCPTGEWRHAWLELSGNTLTMHHADGSSTAITNSLFGTVAPTGVRFQLKAIGTAEFGSPWCGGNRAAQFRAIGEGATIQQVSRLEQFTRDSIPPTTKTLTDNVTTDIAVIEVASGARTTSYEFVVHADINSNISGYAFAAGRWLVVVTGFGGGSIFGVYQWDYTHDSWSPGPSDPQISLALTARHAGTTCTVELKITQTNGTIGNHVAEWTARRIGGDASSVITAL